METILFSLLLFIIYYYVLASVYLPVSPYVTEVSARRIQVTATKEAEIKFRSV